MANYTPMKKIWEARRLVMSGYTVKEISERIGISKSVIYNYTKDERSRVKSGR